MKRILLIALVCILAVGMVACSKAPKEVTPSKEILEADLYELKMNFDGVEIAFPITVREFAQATGWKTNYDLSDKVDANSTILTSDLKLESGNRMVLFTVMDNIQGEEIEFGDCYIKSMMIDNNTYDDILGGRRLDVIMPKGITFDSTEQEIIDAYGEPDEKSDGYLTYTGETGTTIEFAMDQAGGKRAVKVIIVRM